MIWFLNCGNLIFQIWINVVSEPRRLKLSSFPARRSAELLLAAARPKGAKVIGLDYQATIDYRNHDFL